MKTGGWMMGAAALVLVAACAQPPKPLTDGEKAALADSVGQVAAEYIASMSPRVDVDKMMSYYERRPDLVVAGEGMVWVGYDSLAKLARVEYPAGSSVTGTLDREHFTILSREVVVLTSPFRSVMKDSAGKETREQGALTFVFHRTGEGWKIAVEASSSAMPEPPPANPARKR